MTKRLNKAAIGFIFISMFITASLYAQEQIVTGTITDTNDNNATLPGVTVQVKGTTRGTITDLDGNYAINVQSEDILVFSFVGYQTVEIEVRSQRIINVPLTVASTGLDEVVVIGYGAVRKQDITSSIQQVKGDDLTMEATGNFTKMLQTKASGVQVFNPSGAPGANPTVIIRGVTSVNGSSDPMYVVDGIPVGTNANQINPEDIESIQILKDASATAIYGTQASNGVILITTKKGKVGETKFTVSSVTSMQTLRKPPIASAKEYALVMDEMRKNSGNAPLFGGGYDDLHHTDWWDEAVRSLAPRYDLNIGFSGGDEKMVYSGSIGCFKQESQLDAGYWDRISARFNTEYRLTKNIKFGQNFSPRVETWVNTPEINDLMRMDPTTPVYLSEEDQAGKNKYSIYQRSLHNMVWNPIAAIERGKVNNNNSTMALQTNSYLNISFLEHFTFNTQLGLDFRNDLYDTYDPEFFIDAQENNNISRVSREIRQQYAYVFNNILSFVKTFDDVHNVNAMAGLVAEKGLTKYVWGQKEGIPNDDDLLIYLNAATQNPDASGVDVVDKALLSQLSRVMYNYDNKYYATFSIRRDGSFKFPEDNRYAIFPSTSLAWVASKESFVGDNLPWVNNLKIRAGWGQVGNQAVLGAGVFTENIDADKDYVFGGEPSLGIAASNVANKDIKWETVEDYSVGLDLGVLSHSVTLSADYFYRKTVDMLLERTYPGYSGFPSSIWTNSGSVASKGFEMSLSYNKYEGEFTFRATLNFTHVKTRALELLEGQPYTAWNWGFAGSDITRTEEGELVGQFYGYKTQGIFQNWEEVLSYTDENGNLIQPNAKPGDFRFEDINGDGKIDEEDKTFIGSAQPDFTAALNFSARYKNFDLIIDFYGSVGGDLFNTTKAESMTGAENVNVREGLYNEAWHGEGTSNSQPALSLVDDNNNFRRVSDYYVEDGSFLRCRNIQLGYTFKEVKTFNDAAPISQIRIFLGVENLFTITGYSGLDPEVYGGGVTTQGIDSGGRYPTPQFFTFGLSMNL